VVAVVGELPSDWMIHLVEMMVMVVRFLEAQMLSLIAVAMAKEVALVWMMLEVFFVLLKLLVVTVTMEVFLLSSWASMVMQVVYAARVAVEQYSVTITVADLF
jgi:hypothetical protein